MPLPDAGATSSSPAQTQVAVFTPELDWDRRWLFDQPCAAPCWENISPGKTTADEAVIELSRNPLIRDVIVVTATLVPQLGSLEWTWFDGSYGGSAEFDASSDTGLIQVIKPFLANALPWEMVLEKLGEPTAIVAIGDHGPDINSPILYELFIFHQTRGLALLTFGGEVPPVLSPDLTFDMVVFFDPSVASLDSLAPYVNWRTVDLRAWEGFREFSYYCHDRSNQPCHFGK